MLLARLARWIFSLAGATRHTPGFNQASKGNDMRSKHHSTARMVVGSVVTQPASAASLSICSAWLHGSLALIDMGGSLALIGEGSVGL